MTWNPTTEKVALVLILALALGLRLFNLTRNSLWYDETLDLDIAHRTPFWETFTIFSKYDVHPPLQFPVMHLWVKLVGLGEANVRLLSVIAAVITIAVTYYIARRYLDRKIAFTAMLFLSVSPLQLFWSQSIRPYSWFALLVIISLGATLFVSERPTQLWRWAIYIPLAAILPYTHYLGFHVILAEAVFLLFVFFRQWGNILRLLVSLMLVGACFIPWLSNFLLQTTYGLTFFTNTGPSQLIATLVAFSSEFIPNGYLMLVGAVFLPLYLIGLIWVWQNRAKMAVFLFCSSLLPVFTSWLSSLIRPNFGIRYFMFCVPTFLMTVAVGIWVLARYWKYAPYLALLAVLGLNLISEVNYTQHYSYQDWRGMVNHIVANQQDNDLIFLSNPWNYTQPSFDYYYLHQLAAPGNLDRLAVTDQAKVKEQVASIFKNRQRIWMVSLYDGYGNWVINNIFPNLPPGYKSTFKMQYGNPEQSILELILLEKQPEG